MDDRAVRDGFGVELLLHPVRLRVVSALLGGRRLTVGRLREELSDVSPATLYRHIAVLVEAGLLVVTDTRPARGAVERTYALAVDRPQVSPDELAAMSAEDHRRSFAVFVSGLISAFERYVSEPFDFVADAAGYRQAAFWATDEEAHAAAAALRQAMEPFLAAPEGDGRRRRLLVTALLVDPAGRGAEQDPDQDAEDR